MPAAGSRRTNKGTNVRFSTGRRVRPVFALLSRLAPGPAARIAAELFSRPHRGRRPARETRWLADAVRFTLEVEGRELAAWSWGDGPTILLQHGWSGRGSQLAACVPRLLAAGFSVVTYDAPAHGDSPGRHANALLMGRVLAAIERRIGIHGLVAHSLGCTAALLALRGGLRARRLVFLAPPADMEVGSRMFCAQLGFDGRVHDGMVRWWERRLGIRWDMFTAETLGAGRTQPLLILHDRDDPYLPVAHARRLQRAWTGARLLETRGLGHHRHLGDPASLEAIVAFLAGADTPAAESGGVVAAGRPAGDQRA